MDIPGSGWAEHYATRPYGHYKQEVYQLFADILATLSARSKILDVGAGPGHLAYEFFKKYIKSTFAFSLVDASSDLLKWAESRLKNKKVKTFHRSYFDNGWDKGLGKFNAVVSTNAPFPHKTSSLKKFFSIIYSHIKKRGIFLYLYPFGYGFQKKAVYSGSVISDFMNGLPARILPEIPGQIKADKKKLEREKKTAVKVHDEAVAEFKQQGGSIPEVLCEWKPVSVQHHLKSLHETGFEADCIWKKRRYGVILGIRGDATGSRRFKGPRSGLRPQTK
jgi:SAM-dependent methyltransferase